MAVLQIYLQVTSRDRPNLIGLPPGSNTVTVNNALFDAGDKLSRLSGEAEEQGKELQASREQTAQLESEIDRRTQQLQAAKQQVKAECKSRLPWVVVQSVSACHVMHRTWELQEVVQYVKVESVRQERGMQQVLLDQGKAWHCLYH